MIQVKYCWTTGFFWSKLREFADRFKGGQEREAGETDGDRVDELVRPLSAE